MQGLQSIFSKMYNIVRLGGALCARQSADLLAPPFCLSCQKFLAERTHLCDECLAAVPPVASCWLEVTEKYTVPVYAFAPYGGVIRSLVIAKHYGNRTASVQLGELMARHIVCPWHQYDVVVPVPLHWTRFIRRGFNQTNEMAKRISCLRGLVYDTGIKRSRKTLFQAGLDRSHRHENVAQKFSLSSGTAERYAGKHILIVDDLMTTGATVREVARVIARCKPASIGVLVGARVL